MQIILFVIRFWHFSAINSQTKNIKKSSRPFLLKANLKLQFTGSSEILRKDAADLKQFVNIRFASQVWSWHLLVYHEDKGRTGKRCPKVAPANCSFEAQ